MSARIVRGGAAPSPQPGCVTFIDPDNEVWQAAYLCGRWMAIGRWWGHELRHRRSRRPYLQAGKVRVPVRVLAPLPTEPDDLVIF